MYSGFSLGVNSGLLPVPPQVEQMSPPCFPVPLQFGHSDALRYITCLFVIYTQKYFLAKTYL